MTFQVTLFDATNKYKPVSALVETKADTPQAVIMKRGAEKICQKRYWTTADLKKYNYTKVKIREYDKAKIEEENKTRYEKIKEEKYKSGEWIRPKNK